MRGFKRVDLVGHLRIGKENCGVVGSLLIGSLQFSMDNNMDAHLG